MTIYSNKWLYILWLTVLFSPSLRYSHSNWPRLLWRPIFVVIVTLSGLIQIDSWSLSTLMVVFRDVIHSVLCLCLTFWWPLCWHYFIFSDSSILWVGYIVVHSTVKYSLVLLCWPVTGIRDSRYREVCNASCASRQLCSNANAMSALLSLAQPVAGLKPVCS